MKRINNNATERDYDKLIPPHIHVIVVIACTTAMAANALHEAFVLKLVVLVYDDIDNILHRGGL